MTDKTSDRHRGERGSALVIATLVMVIMTLLGVSFLMMAQTENKIAENEKLSAQALYFAEAGARTAKKWFDRPASTTATHGWNLAFPTVAQVRRDLRLIDTDGAGPTAPVLTDGNAAGTRPYYKQLVDVNGDGIEDLFDRPYRTNALNTFLGTAGGPDVRISRADSNAAKTFLDGMSEKLMAGFPAAGAGIRARLQTIDFYSPPYLLVGTQWTRYGLATIAVTAQIIKTVGTTETVLAQRTIRAVVNETPYPGPFGPLHSCDELTFTGDFNVHWGSATAAGPSTTDLPNNLNKLWMSIPRYETPPNAKVDWFYGHNTATFTAMRDSIQAGSVAIEDPWFRVVSGGKIADFPDGTYPNNQVFPPSAGYAPDHSNIYKNMGSVACPEMDYFTWKTVAQSGGSDVHYYTWVTGTQYAQNGSGPPTEFKDITGGKTGLFFFDTKNQGPPEETTGDRYFDNLTPDISLQGGQWGGSRGFLYVNTDTFAVNGTNNQGMDAQFTYPGEPYDDLNEDGKHDPGEPHINLNYTTLATGNLATAIRGSATDNFGGTAGMYNAQGPSVTDKALFWGVLYNSGQFDSQGTPRFLGSLITKTGQVKSGGTVDIYWDPKIATSWPPAEWDLPRVIVTRWETDL